MSVPVISARGLSKLYPLGSNNAGGMRIYRDLIRPLVHGPGTPPSEKDEAPDGMFWALRGVTFEIAEGERVGIIGRNGAGKTTLFKILSRLAYPTMGEAVIRGRVTSLLEVGTGFNDELSGRDNIYLNASLHGLNREEVNERLEQIIEFSELRRFIDAPLRHYSSGMRARLGFSVAAHLDPDILILDEVLSVGDIAFQRKCIERMNEVSQQSRTLMFVSHSMSSLRDFCDRGIWLERGQIMMDGAIEEVVELYSKDALLLTGTRTWDAKENNAAPPKTPEASDVAAEPVTPDEEPAARLIAASVNSGQDRDVVSITADEAIELEAVYEVIRAGETVLPTFRIYDENGTLAFTATYSHDDYEEKGRQPGRYRARTRIPGNFLNLGRTTVSIGLNTPRPGKLKRHHVVEEALTFVVHEVPYPGSGGRGPYSSVKGAVRPRFEWEISQLQAPESPLKPEDG